jgi:hypothetical protein
MDGTRKGIRIVAVAVVSAVLLGLATAAVGIPVLNFAAIPFLAPGALLARLFDAKLGSGGWGVLMVDYLWIWSVLYFVPTMLANRRRQRERG